ncbi:putative enzyme related to lactoylglutathione lyase [Janthinobacterium sp. CG_23.3]|uniref:VOC family protein n=1 Tax=unclassified Janthinobacterium TaxID=2610881 RepID=UPI00034BAB35|nr:VOC family protein [Janthinobacterium sp. CG_S6]MEC5158994.1 putative enzyme related to lactoylglutathione lyase [Janthinobacterium sp. CG_S6]
MSPATVSHPNFFILYVDRPLASADFYAALLGRAPVEASATFAMFALDSGVMLGLWSKHTVEPAAAAGGGGAEVAFAQGGKDAVDAVHADWLGKGVPILQAPLHMDFGYTFVAQDPDGHRLRVFAAGA